MAITYTSAKLQIFLFQMARRNLGMGIALAGPWHNCGAQHRRCCGGGSLRGRTSEGSWSKEGVAGGGSGVRRDRLQSAGGVGLPEDMLGGPFGMFAVPPQVLYSQREDNAHDKAEDIQVTHQDIDKPKVIGQISAAHLGGRR